MTDADEAARSVSAVPASGGDAPASVPAAGASVRGGRSGRWRRENVTGGRQHRHVVKVTPQEEAALLMRAERDQVTVARLLVESALSPVGGETPTQRREQSETLFRLYRLLANVANNVNQIARVANTERALDPDTEVSLRATLEAVRRTAMRVDEALEERATVNPRDAEASSHPAVHRAGDRAAGRAAGRGGTGE